jgi:hypothetical protein
MEGTVTGFTITGRSGEVGPLQLDLKAYTENVPEAEVAVNVTVIILVLLPEVMITPGGTLQ